MYKCKIRFLSSEKWSTTNWIFKHRTNDMCFLSCWLNENIQTVGVLAWWWSVVQFFTYLFSSHACDDCPPTFWLCKSCSIDCEIDPCLHIKRLTPQRIIPSCTSIFLSVALCILSLLSPVNFPILHKQIHVQSHSHSSTSSHQNALCVPAEVLYPSSIHTRSSPQQCDKFYSNNSRTHVNKVQSVLT